MNASAPSGNPARPRQSGRLLTLVILGLAVFGAGFVAAVAWIGPRGDSLSPGVPPVTATALPPTPAPAPTHAPATVDTASADGADLSTLYIDIAAPELARLEAKREEALATWILQTGPQDFVDARLRPGGEAELPVRLRLKGDWGDHFTGDKWSYRVEIRDGGAFRGMTAFSLQAPSTRSYLNEWLFTENLRAEDILAVRYGFVEGVQNGESKGVYAVEEAFTKELVESLGRREGVIIRYDEDLLWSFWSAFDNDLSVPAGVQRFHIIDEFDSARVSADPALTALRDVAVGKLRSWWASDLAASEVFDTETTARFWALADLWGAQHALEWHNLRYYYNPVTALLEPIGFDAQPLGAGARVDPDRLQGYTAALSHGDARLQQAYAAELWTVSRSDYVDGLEAAYGAVWQGLRSALAPEYGGQVAASGAPALDPPWDVLRRRQGALRELLSPLQMAYAYLGEGTPEGGAWLDVGNLTGFPVSVEALEFGDHRVAIESGWVDAGSLSRTVPDIDAGEAVVLRPLSPDAGSMPYVRLFLPPAIAEGLPAGDEVRLHTRIWGLDEGVSQPVLRSYPPPSSGPIPKAPSLSEALEDHELLRQDGEAPGALTVRPGVWTVQDPLVLPDGVGLTLEAGTTLRFGPDAFLLARGPLIFRGTASDPILLAPIDDAWRGIVVLESATPSELAHVTVRDTDVIDLAGWALTGAITFYRSPVALLDVRILGTRAEDALNTIRSDFVLVRTEFAGTASDAFDADFCEGRIEQASFHDIGADAIDTSGSRVSVTSVAVRDIGDKAVSAGEASEVTITYLDVARAVFGVVSKDLSHVEAAGVTVSDVEIAALAAYTKKASFGPATMTVTGLVVDDVPQEQVALVQTGSWIELDGTRLWGTDIDVDALYR